MKFDILPIPQHFHQLDQYQQHYLTIEDIKSTRNSCWLCGCNWLEDHVSLDCSECGGYALTRPCVNCDGKCGETWQRDISRSHDSHRARFSGRCRLHSRDDTRNNDNNDGTLTDDDLPLSKSERIAQLLRSTTTTRGKRSSGHSNNPMAMHHQATTNNSSITSPYHLGKSATNKTTITTTTSTSCFSTSSCCSSQPSSATNSDEDQDS